MDLLIVKCVTTFNFHQGVLNVDNQYWINVCLRLIKHGIQIVLFAQVVVAILGMTDITREMGKLIVHDVMQKHTHLDVEDAHVQLLTTLYQPLINNGVQPVLFVLNVESHLLMETFSFTTINHIAKHITMH